MLHVGNKATYIILAVIIAGLGTTMSRKGVLTAMLSPLIYYYFTERKIKAVVIACIGVLLLPIIILSTSMFSKRVDSDQVQQELSARAGMASAGVKMFSESPILGKGFGGYYDNILKFNRNLTKAYSAHNIYAEALADYGLIGFSLLATCFMLPIRRATVLFRNHGIVNNSDINPQKFGALLLAVIIPFMCSAYFSGALLYEPKIFSVLYAYICYAYHQ
jgi:O-antigen ligase